MLSFCKMIHAVRTLFHAIACALLLVAAASGAHAASALPREPSQLLLIGDSVTAGIYFMSLNPASVQQSWAGQLARELGLDPPRAPYGFTFPIDHLKLAQAGFFRGGFTYMWQARRVVKRGSPQFPGDEERVVLAIPGQTLEEMLTQSSETRDYNKGSSGWTFANLLLPRGLTAIETVEHWQKRPEWIVVFIGSNDLLASFGIVGKAVPPTPDIFEERYRELVDRLRARMAPGTPPAQFFVMTLPDVTRLPFLQPLPEGADDGRGEGFPAGSVASAFLIPFRTHYEDDEAWTPAELDTIRARWRAYNSAIRRIADDGGLTVVPIDSIMAALDGDPAFSTPDSPYFSPDLHHPSYLTHAVIAGSVLRRMAAIAGEPVPQRQIFDVPLPSAHELAGDHSARVAAMMHLALLGLASGPLPPDPTWRLGAEIAGQGGREPLADGTLSLLAGIEVAPFPTATWTTVRIGASLRAAALAYDDSRSELEFFPQRSFEARAGLGFERTAAWTWARVEAGGLLTLDGEWDGGLYARGEWRGLYVETAGRGWWFDRVEAGLRLGIHPGRPGRNGN